MSTSPYLLPSGDPDWKKIDQRIIAERKKGTSLKGIPTRPPRAGIFAGVKRRFLKW